jgi:hypothetical protein
VILPRAPLAYSIDDQGRLRSDLEREDGDNLKRGRDIELGVGRVIGTSPNGSRFVLVFNNDGTLTTGVL